MSLAKVFPRGLLRGYTDYFFAVEQPVNLAIGRIVLFGYAFIYFSLIMPVDFTALCEIPDLFLQIPGLTRFLGFGVAAKANVAVIQFVWMATSIGACLGLLTRINMIVATILFGYLVALTNAYGHPRIGHPLLFFAMVIICTAPCGQVLSLDSLFFRHRGVRASQPPLVWQRKIIFLLPILVIWGAGLEKLRTSGLSWGWSNTLKLLIHSGRYQFALTDFQLATSRFAADYLPMRFAAASGLALELTAPLALFKTRLRTPMISALFGFIIVIWWTVAEPMFEFMTLLTFGIDWHALGMRGRQLVSRRTEGSD